MEYNDELIPTPENYEKMAKAYSNALKEKGFVFIRLSNEDFCFLIDEIFDILFKLRSSYRYLKGFMGSDKFLELNEEQIEELRDIFSYSKNRAFQIRTNKTKCFLNTVSLETRLILKLNELAQKSEYFEKLSSIASKRLLLSTELYSIEGIFNNLTNLSFL